MTRLELEKLPCLKEINPEQWPGVYFGKPWKYDLTYGACHDCLIKEDCKKVAEDGGIYERNES